MGNTSEMQTMLAQSIEQMLSRQGSVESLCADNPKPDLWALLVDLGLPAAELPANCGGLELAFSDVAPAFRQIGEALATTYLAEFTIMGGWIVATCDAPWAREVASGLALGEARIAVAFNEYGDGGHMAFTRTSAVKAGEYWQINGRKAVVVGGDRATHLIVPAIISPDAGHPAEELALFLIPTNTAGVTAHKVELYDGSFAADFDLYALNVPVGNLIARGAAAVDLLGMALDRGRAALCHEIVGLMGKVTEMTLDYVKARRQFGQPIGMFQTMQHRMADMHMEMELAQSCAELATAAIDAPDKPDERMRTVSAAMVGICRCARRTGQSSIQAHGGIALTQDYAVGHYFKRLTLAERYLGNAEFHVERYISRKHTLGCTT